MKVNRSQFPVFMAVKMTEAQAEEIKRQAREDDRTVSSYLRRLITAAMSPASGHDDESSSR